MLGEHIIHTHTQNSGCSQKKVPATCACTPGFPVWFFLSKMSGQMKSQHGTLVGYSQIYKVAEGYLQLERNQCNKKHTSLILLFCNKAFQRLGQLLLQLWYISDSYSHSYLAARTCHLNDRKLGLYVGHVGKKFCWSELCR